MTNDDIMELVSVFLSETINSPELRIDIKKATRKALSIQVEENSKHDDEFFVVYSYGPQTHIHIAYQRFKILIENGEIRLSITNHKVVKSCFGDKVIKQQYQMIHGA